MFNITTGLTIWCTEALTLAAISLFAWLHDRRSTHYLSWALGFLAGAVGFGLAATRGFTSDLFSIEIGNAVALSGYSAWAIGFYQMDRRPIHWSVALPPALWIIGVNLPWVYPSFSNRVVLYTLVTAVGALLLATAVGGNGQQREKARLPLTITLLTLALANFLAALAIGLLPVSQPTASAYRGISALSSALLITTAITMTGRLLLERSVRRWQVLSMTDYLTGALNRRGLETDVAHMLETHARRSGLVAALAFDLDHFKAVNDRHGHQAGDRILIEFARIARSLIPEDALFGRPGGEEFIAFMPVKDQTEAEAIADLIRAEFGRVPHMAGSALVSATVSGGIAILPAAEASWDILVPLADRALYAAKKAGRDCIIVFGEEEAAAADEPAGLDSGEMVATLDDQIHALRRMGTISRM